MTEWKKLIPKPKTHFFRVKCPNCGNEQIIFSHTTTPVNCNICGALLAEPAGGRAKLKGDIVTTVD
jgi:small subunit ribosomal protein S27e